jgi:hypothetical protein
MKLETGGARKRIKARGKKARKASGDAAANAGSFSSLRRRANVRSKFTDASFFFSFSDF